MTFGVAAFLLAALAAIIPPILHMINRQRAKQLPFSTLRFLKISVQKTRRRRQIRDIFLMLLRMAVLVLIAIGLARPTLSKVRSLFGGSQAAVAIVLDNSASMGWIDEGRPRFELAIAAANQILAELQAGDEVALWVTSGRSYPELGKFDRQHDKVRQLLAQIAQQGPTFERGTLMPLISQAREQLAQSQAPQRYLFVITDNQSVAWEGLEENRDRATADTTTRESATEDRRLRDIPIVLVDCQRNPRPSVAVRKVTVQSVLPVAGVPMKVVLELFNASSVSQQRVAEVYVDGNKVGTTPELTIPPEGAVPAEVVFTLDRGGIHQGEVRLVGEDGARFDDRRFFTIEIEAAIPVAVVINERREIAYLNDSFYLEKALEPIEGQNWAIKTTLLTSNELTTEPLSNYRIIYLVNLQSLEASVVEKLATFVRNGGRLVWVAGEEVDPATYNGWNEMAGGSLLPVPLDSVRAADTEEGRDSWHVNWLDVQHAALSGFAEPPSLYQSILVYKYVKIKADETDGARVLLRLDGEGDPLLVEKQVGDGIVLFLGTSVHVGWTNFPLRPIFAPLMARLAFYLAGGEPTQSAGLAGQPLVIPFLGQIPPGVVEVTPPSGSLMRFNIDPQSKEFRYSDTHQIGVYQFRLLASVRPVQKAFAVNVDPDESDPTKIENATLEEAFSGIPVVFAENPEDLSQTFDFLRNGKSLAEFFLTLVLLGLVFETFISNWFSPRDEEKRPRPLEGYRPTRRLAPQLG
ncbi:MAG: BatA domain-containing protein [Thermogutta sp.]|uniref:BatA domain-containing protein n=1 Tax=Thermogutta sp. TaxID=1962930 RepID=UPI0019CE1E3D|nr:BatA domain-containing protein [Thermogutta sp.]MBC7351011.1 BatA domain-containing protein [Thermogutta sp.]